MNIEQIKQLCQTLLAAGGPVAGLLTAYGFPQDKVAMWLGLALAIVPPLAAALWGILDKTDSAIVVQAKAVPGVETVVVSNKAPPALAKLADDDAHPHIVTAAQNEIDAKNGGKS